MTVAASCLDRDSLKSLLEHGADPVEIDRLAGHLETCPRCGETVDGLLSSDPTEAALRGVKIAPDEPSVQMLRARLANLRIADASHETTAGENTQSAVSAPSIEATQDKSVSLAPPQQPDEIGRLGGYRILAELGRGGMGVVYKAEDLKLKRLVALKVMAPSLAANAVSRERFLREAVAMAAVHHDNIVVIHTVDEDNGVPFLAMEFLQGMPLDTWLKGGRKATPAQVLKIGREIAEGLAAAHERGLIHRDVKPGNIWLDSAHKGRVKILDFGLARSGTEDVHLTHTGAVVGTPAYMAPEQARAERIDGRSDLFSLGCVLYKLCTGAMPFAGDTTMALLMSLATDHPKSVRELNPDMPAELSDLVKRLLEKEPAKRPQSAREVVQAIQAIEDSLDKRAAGLLATAITAAIVIIIRDANGNKVAEVPVPPGGTAQIVGDNDNKPAKLVAPPGDMAQVAVDAKRAGSASAPKPPLDEAWFKRVAALPPEKQVEEVAAELKRRNPGFDGKMKPQIGEGRVWDLELYTDSVTDVTPVRALTRMTQLHLSGSEGGKGRLMDLSPLKRMRLSQLLVINNPVEDISVIKELPLLESFGCSYTKVSDLSSLQGVALTSLHFDGAPVSDLSPLKGMPLVELSCRYTAVSDLSPLKGLPLRSLTCDGTNISDLSPLKGMALTHLDYRATFVTDPSVLKGMPLKVVYCDTNRKLGFDILRSIKTLETINGKPAAEFWKEVDAKQP